MSLTDLEIKKYTEPLEKELDKQKQKNGRLQRRIHEAKEEMREACAQEVRTALIEAGEDPRAADSMFSRIRAVEIKRTPLKKAMQKAWESAQEAGVFLKVWINLNGTSSSFPTLRKALSHIESSRDVLHETLEDP